MGSRRNRDGTRRVVRSGGTCAMCLMGRASGLCRSRSSGMVPGNRNGCHGNTVRRGEERRRTYLRALHPLFRVARHSVSGARLGEPGHSQAARREPRPVTVPQGNDYGTAPGGPDRNASCRSGRGRASASRRLARTRDTGAGRPRHQTGRRRCPSGGHCGGLVRAWPHLCGTTRRPQPTGVVGYTMMESCSTGRRPVRSATL